MEEKLCLECDRSFQGRSDKKFCTDACRNAYNNKQNSDQTNLMRVVNAALRKNWRILEKLNPEDKTKTHRDKLARKGFDFEYITNIYKNKKGDEYRFVYDQGYLDIGNDFYLLVKRQEK
ncbi:MAG: hypothetical protein JXQ90_19295 [Cyclobacteriaceae bacterium]